MKKEVYSWRVSSELKSALEREARRRKTSVASLLDIAAREWLKSSVPAPDDEEEQRRLHAAVEKCIGVISGGNHESATAENVRKVIRQRLKRYGT